MWYGREAAGVLHEDHMSQPLFSQASGQCKTTFCKENKDCIATSLV